MSVNGTTGDGTNTDKAHDDEHMGRGHDFGSCSWRNADVIAYENIEEPTAVRAAVVIEMHHSTPSQHCAHEGTKNEYECGEGTIRENGKQQGLKSFIVYATHNILVLTDVVTNVDGLCTGSSAQETEQIQFVELWRTEFSGRIDGLITVDGIGFDKQLLLVICSDGVCTLIEIESSSFKKIEDVNNDSCANNNVKIDKKQAPGYVHWSSEHPESSIDSYIDTKSNQMGRLKVEHKRYYNVMCSIAIDDELIEKCTGRGDNVRGGKRLRTNGCLLGSATKSDCLTKAMGNIASNNTSADPSLYIPLCLYEGILTILRIYTCESIVDPELYSIQSKMACIQVHCVELDSTFDNMRQSNGIAAGANVPDRLTTTNVVSCCFLKNNGIDGNVYNKDFLVLLVCKESHRKSDMTCYCFEFDTEKGKLLEVIWLLGNLHPTTRKVLNVQGRGDFLVAIVSSQGLLLVSKATGDDDDEILLKYVNLQMNGLPLTVTFTKDDFMIVQDSAGYLYYTHLQNGASFKKVAAEYSRGFSLSSSILYIPELGGNDKLFIGSETGDSCVLSLPTAMWMSSDILDESQDRELMIPDKDIHIVIPSLSPVICCKSFEMSSGRGEVNLAMLSGSGSSSSLRVAHFGVSLQAYASADVFGENFPDRPRLLSFFSNEKVDTHLLLSFHALNETQALDVTGMNAIFSNVEIPGFDHNHATLATGCAAGDYSIQVTPLSVRLLQSLPEWKLLSEWCPQESGISVAAADYRGRIVVGCAESIVAVEARNGTLMQIECKSLENQASAIGICQSDCSNPLLAIGTWLENTVDILQWPTLNPLTQINTSDAQPRSILILSTDSFGNWEEHIRPQSFDIFVGAADGSLLYWSLKVESSINENYLSNPQVVQVASSEVNLQLLRGIHMKSTAASSPPRSVSMIYANSEKDAIVFKVNEKIIVERIDGESRMSVFPLKSSCGRFLEEDSLLWLSNEGLLSIGHLNFCKMLQSKRLPMPNMTLRFLEYLSNDDAFIVIGEEEDCNKNRIDTLCVVKASDLSLVASMHLEYSHRITSTLLIHVDSSTELLLVASSLSDGADRQSIIVGRSSVSYGLISVFEVEKAKSETNESKSSTQWSLKFHGSHQVDHIVTSMDRVVLKEHNTFGTDNCDSLILACGCPSNPQIRLYQILIDIDFKHVEHSLENSLDAITEVDGDMDQVYNMLVDSQQPVKIRLLATLSTPHGGCISSIKGVGDNTIYASEFMAGVVIVEIVEKDAGTNSTDCAKTDGNREAINGVRGDDRKSKRSSYLDPNNFQMRILAVDRMDSFIVSTLTLDKGDSLLASTHTGDIVLLGRNYADEADCLSRYLAERYRSFEDGRGFPNDQFTASRRTAISETITNLSLLARSSRWDLILGMSPGLLGLRMHEIEKEYQVDVPRHLDRLNKQRVQSNSKRNFLTYVTSTGCVGVMSPFTREEFEALDVAEIWQVQNRDTKSERHGTDNAMTSFGSKSKCNTTTTGCTSFGKEPMFRECKNLLRKFLFLD